VARLPPHIAFGEWSLVRWRSGEYLCFGNQYREALGCLLGWHHEDDVVRIFRTFLTRESVVLDIGANIGLYTAVAGTSIGPRGRVYAFEGNPAAFAALQRTIWANELFDEAKVVAANVLVSDRCGRGTLYFPSDILVGGTMTEAILKGDQRGHADSIEVDMTSIDAYLPPDLLVDLVKIDVEGHEPLVIRGMEQTIARSPNIRLIIEFVDYMLEQTVKSAEFVDYIRGLGFHICRCLKGFKLRLVPPGEPITGFNYLLLTRTPEADIAAVEHRRRYPPIRFKRWWSRHGPDWERYRKVWDRY
jgi:FkbM family methyltransferase